MPLPLETQLYIIDLIDDEEEADNYAKHAFYCGFHIVGLCTDPEGECSKRREL
jgi:hypothetical protein